jgi:hypothetical protein
MQDREWHRKVAPLERRVAGFRDVLIHVYMGVDLDEVWAVVERDLPSLKTRVEVMRLTPPGPTNQHAFTAMSIPLATCISGRTDHLEIAEAAAGTVLASPFRTGHIDGFARTGLALLAIWRSDAMGARQQYTILKAQQGIMLPFAMIAVDRLLGCLALTMGQATQAMIHFEDALAFSRKAGFRPELAWTCHDYADALLRRNAPGDRARAAFLLDESWSISGELGMGPLQERAASLRGQSQSPTPRGPAYPGGLTHREVEVLRLVASGQTSAEIAAELVLSRRSEVTAFAFTHGLISSA